MPCIWDSRKLVSGSEMIRNGTDRTYTQYAHTQDMTPKPTSHTKKESSAKNWKNWSRRKRTHVMKLEHYTEMIPEWKARHLFFTLIYCMLNSWCSNKFATKIIRYLICDPCYYCQLYNCSLFCIIKFSSLQGIYCLYIRL